ncbi:unnamed protein product [Closterium sp. Yama58-4]|nr:unnamed protein product [Closterium sp. Yama58-4]
MWWLANALNFPFSVETVCVFTAPVFSAHAAWATFLLAKEVRGTGAGLTAAALIAMVPSYISRSVAGSYDNEGVAIFALVFTFYLYIKTLNTGSLFYATANAAAYFYMVMSWGGYTFIINLIPIHSSPPLHSLHSPPTQDHSFTPRPMQRPISTCAVQHLCSPLSVLRVYTSHANSTLLTCVHLSPHPTGSLTDHTRHAAGSAGAVQCLCGPLNVLRACTSLPTSRAPWQIILGTLLAALVPVVGFNAVMTSEHFGGFLVFVVLHIAALSYYIKALLPAKAFRIALTLIVSVGTVAAVALLSALVAMVLASPTLGWTGRSLSLLDPTYASKYIPIIASVSEHQPPMWTSYFMDLQLLAFLAPAGLIACFLPLTDASSFVALYLVVSVYFSGVMVRLMLVLAPAACITAGIAVSALFDVLTRSVKASIADLIDLAYAAAKQDKGEKEDTAAAAAEAASKTGEAASQAKERKAGAGKKKKGKEGEGEGGESDEEPAGGVSGAEKRKGVKGKGKGKGGKEKEKGKEKFPLVVPGDAAAVGIILMLVGLAFYTMHCVWAAADAYSAPSIVLSSPTQDGGQYIFDDFREAYGWLRHNTDVNDKVASWWDYGYQTTAMANRTVIVDNNTWNNTHIATVGMAMSSREKDAWAIYRSIDVKYVFVVFGGMVGYPSDDINKFLWMVRIGGGVFPRIREPDYLNNGNYRVDGEATSTMLNCLMYKLSYYRFAEVDGRGFDRVRRTEIGKKNIKLTHFEEVFTSQHWMVRIYRLKEPRNRPRGTGKRLTRVSANKAKGFWFVCFGNRGLLSPCFVNPSPSGKFPSVDFSNLGWRRGYFAVSHSPSPVVRRRTYFIQVSSPPFGFPGPPLALPAPPYPSVYVALLCFPSRADVCWSLVTCIPYGQPNQLTFFSTFVFKPSCLLPAWRVGLAWLAPSSDWHSLTPADSLSDSTLDASHTFLLELVHHPSVRHGESLSRHVPRALLPPSLSISSRYLATRLPKQETSVYLVFSRLVIPRTSLLICFFSWRIMEHSSAFDAVMADNAGITPSFSDLLGDGSPVAKKVCKAASSSSSKLPAAAPRPVPATNAEVSSAPSLGVPGKRFRRLCAQRDSVGETVADVERDFDSLVAVIFPDHLAVQHRKDIVSCIKKSLRRSDFKSWQIPTFKSMAGANLKFGKNTYSRQILQFPTKEAADDFRARPPIFFSPPNGPAVELKVYTDPAPEFTAAKERGETHIVLRNIPLGLSEEKLHSALMNGKNRDGQKWLADLKHFHSASDPYEEMFQLQMHGIVAPMPGDGSFSVTPPLLWIPGVREPVLVNLSCHSCSICSSHHRTEDHHVFPTLRRNKINNPYAISVAQLQNINDASLVLPASFQLFSGKLSKALGHSPAVIKFKQDLGLLFISLDSDVEAWTCCACDFTCGWTIDTALAHCDAMQHLRRLQTSGVLLKEEYGDMKALDFLKNDQLLKFMAEE